MFSLNVVGICQVLFEQMSVTGEINDAGSSSEGLFDAL